MLRTISVMLTVSAALLISSAVRSQEAVSTTDQIKHWVDEQTIAIGIIDLKRIDIDASFGKVAALLGPAAPASEPAKGVLTRIKNAILQAGGERILLVCGNNELGGAPCVIIPIKDAQQSDAIASLIITGKAGAKPETTSWLGEKTTWKLINNCVVIGTPRAVVQRETMKPVARPDLAAAMQGMKDTAIQGYLIPSADLRKVMSETVPSLPKVLGGGSSKVVTQGLRWATLSANLPPQMGGTLRVQAGDATQAEELSKLWKTILQQMQQEMARPSDHQYSFKVMHQLLSSIEVLTNNNQLVMEASRERLEPLTDLLAKSMVANAGNDINSVNLRQMVIAMHNFHADYSHLPYQAICDKEGKPLLSWRVALLPYMGHDNLYKQFKFDESWDSENNKKLIEQMPKTFSHPFAKNVPANHTLYQVFYSKKGAKPAAALMENTKITLGQLTVQDGTSNTMVITDAAPKAVPWTKPEDLLYDGTVENLPKLISPRGDQWAHAGFCDGSVRRFKVNADPKLLWQLIGRNDGFNMDTREVFGDK